MTLQAVEPQTRRWTRDEYFRLAEQGWFRDQRVQLIEGEIIQMPPQGHPHAKALMLVDRWLHRVFGDEYAIRIQMPLNVLTHSDPEPDAAVIAMRAEQSTDHPNTALLVIEISDSSVRLDRRKSSLYAAAGVREYWIVDVEERRIEIYRNPVSDQNAKFGFSYPQPVVVTENESVSPLAKPGATIKAAELLP